MTLSTLVVDGASHHGYASIPEADAALAVDIDRRTAWNALDDADKSLYLVAARVRLDTLDWQGEPDVNATARRTAWGRIGLSPMPTANIPPEIETANALLAADLASGASASADADTTADVQSQTIGNVSVSYFPRRRTQPAGNDKPIPARTAYSLIRQWLRQSNIALPTAAGIDGESVFIPADRYGRTRGFG